MSKIEIYETSGYQYRCIFEEDGFITCFWEISPEELAEIKILKASAERLQDKLRTIYERPDSKELEF